MWVTACVTGTGAEVWGSEMYLQRKREGGRKALLYVACPFFGTTSTICLRSETLTVGESEAG
jgi:hypothetical protein